MGKYRRLLRKSSFILGLIAVLSLSPPSWAKKNSDEVAKGKDAKPPTELYKNLDLFTKVLSLVREDYVEKPDDQEIVYGAIRGLLSNLDPHSNFLTPEAYRELKVDTEGRFGGVGMEVTVKDNVPTVVTAIEGSPAQKAGVREGDRILKIDGIPTKELGLAESVNKMRGARGTKVHLSLMHAGEHEPYEVTLSRDTIKIKSVRSDLLEGNFGYIRIASFQEDTTEDLKKNMAWLEKKSQNKLRGLILDLRNNPGGLLDEAVGVCDLFLDSGTIVTTASRNHEIDKKVATKSGLEPTYPMMVLVNGGSASAAEIVAGALQDQKRAVLLGTQTFGKGSVQTIFELGNGSALKLTIAKYYTPKGRSIQAEGIKPDIIVPAHEPSKKSSGSETKPTAQEHALRERDLKGHLESENSHKRTRSGDHTSSESESEAEAVDETGVKNDYQKQMALDYLKKGKVSDHTKKQ